MICDGSKGGRLMKNQEANEKVIKAISIGLAAFIASSAPMTVLAESDDNQKQEKGNLISDSAEIIVSDVESALENVENSQKGYNFVIQEAQDKEDADIQNNTVAMADWTQKAEDAKYAYDYAESVVGEKKWDYERAKYAYQKAESNYKDYKKNNWKFWEWTGSKEYDAYISAKKAYEDVDISLKESQDAMNKALKEYEALSTQSVRMNI